MSIPFCPVKRPAGVPAYATYWQDAQGNHHWKWTARSAYKSAWLRFERSLLAH